MVKDTPANAGDTGSIPGSERFPGEGNGNSLTSSCLRNPMDRGAWWAIVHGVTKELDMTKRLYNDNSWLISVCEFISVNELGYLKLVIHMLTFILKITCFSVTKSCWLFATAWTVACQAPPSSTFFQSLLEFMSNNVAVSYTDLTLHINSSLLLFTFCFHSYHGILLMLMKPLNIIGKIVQCLDLILSYIFWLTEQEVAIT